ncbi:phosphatidate cytidylyltransferase [Candidatus Pelagibacter sp.]|nr:phosphatidate cytidylyltransferase [Candidatus Pelagibacter sp.]
MIKLEIKKRIITSLFLFFILILMYFYNFVLIISLLIITICAWIEFNSLIAKIFKKKDSINKTLKLACKATSLIYLAFLTYFIIIIKSLNTDLNDALVYALLISILTDIGGLVIGSTIKGNKLTKISPKKTISGALGSFFFSITLVPFYLNIFIDYKIIVLVLITLAISLTSQIGDLFISFLKRKANVKDTSNLLPGHGGILDRIDGMIFAIPISLILFSF